MLKNEIEFLYDFLISSNKLDSNKILDISFECYSCFNEIFLPIDLRFLLIEDEKNYFIVHSVLCIELGSNLKLNEIQKSTLDMLCYFEIFCKCGNLLGKQIKTVNETTKFLKEKFLIEFEKIKVLVNTKDSLEYCSISINRKLFYNEVNNSVDCLILNEKIIKMRKEFLLLCDDLQIKNFELCKLTEENDNLSKFN